MSCVCVSFYRVPDPHDVAFGEVRQGDLCLDTMGHFSGGTVQTNKCHGSAGNQVCKHENILYCLQCLNFSMFFCRNGP